MSGSQADFWQGPTGTLPVVNANGNIFEEVQVATAAQTLFTLASFTYTVGQKSIWVFRRPVATDIGGEMLRRAVDYTETSSSSITLTSPAALGDTLIFIAFGVNQLIAPVVNNGLPQGGATGAVLQKVSGSDYDAVWNPQSSVTTLLDAARSNVASASTINLVALQGTTRNINITGNIQIDGFQVTNGEVWAVRFSGILTLNNNANIVTQTGAVLVTTANATCFLRAIADNVVEVLAYSAPNGPALMSSINSGPVGGKRNFFDNAGCFNSQRGPLVLAATGGNYVVDSWFTSIVGTTVAATIASGAYVGSASGFVISTSNVTTTGATTLSQFTRIEAKNAKRLSGKTITISYKVRHNSATPLTFDIEIYKANASDNFGAVTLIAAGSNTAVPQSTDTLISFTTTLGATDADNGLQIMFNYVTGTALTAISFFHWEMQCEIGSLVTPFEYVPAAITDTTCKRLLYCTTNGNAKGTGVLGGHSAVAVNTSVLQSPFKYPTAMRVVPTIQLWNNGNQNQVRNLGTGVPLAATISSVNGHNTNGFSSITMTAAVLTAGAYYDFDLIASAEL